MICFYFLIVIEFLCGRWIFFLDESLSVDVCCIWVCCWSCLEGFLDECELCMLLLLFSSLFLVFLNFIILIKRITFILIFIYFTAILLMWRFQVLSRPLFKSIILLLEILHRLPLVLLIIKIILHYTWNTKYVV